MDISKVQQSTSTLTQSTLLITGAFIVMEFLHLLTIPAKEGSFIFHLITRGLLVPILIVWISLIQFETSTKAHTLANYKMRGVLSIGLLFATFGDLVIVYQDQAEHIFLMGLCCFIVSHVCFIWAMYVTPDIHKPLRMTKRKLVWIAPITVITALLIVFLKDNLGEVFIPGVVYLISLNGMVFMALDRMERTTLISFWSVLIGSVCFVLADIVLAFNKFYSPIPYGEFWTSILYSFSMYAMVFGFHQHLMRTGTMKGADQLGTEY